jgi:hypothetical protein
MASRIGTTVFLDVCAYLRVLLERHEVLLDEDLGLDERRLVVVRVPHGREADVQVKAQGRPAADPWIH